MTAQGPQSAGPLDGPPPNPAMAQAPMGPMGQPGPMPSFGEMAQPLTAGTPGRAVAPEIAMGLMQTAATMYGLLDSMSSIAPDLANDFALQKDLLQRTMAKMVVNHGTQASSQTSAGLNFPGGGFLGGAQ
jgi:hypothetical protein